MERFFSRWSKWGAWIEAQARNGAGNWQQKSPANPPLPRPSKILETLALPVTITYYPSQLWACKTLCPHHGSCQQQNTNVVDNIHVCLASDLVKPLEGISKSGMVPKDIDFNLYRSILRDKGLFTDKICPICYLDSKGQRLGIYSQSMFVAVVQYQINQAGVDDMITFYGCASLPPKTTKRSSS